MREVQLVRLDPAIEEGLVNDPAYMDAMIQDDWSQIARLVHQRIGEKLTATPVSVDRLEWDGYFVIDADTRDVVGSCAFKGQPTEEGTVEIAYFTYPSFEGQGYATSMASKLIDLASTSATTTRVIAHTLPQARRLDTGAGESRNEFCRRSFGSRRRPSMAMADATQIITHRCRLQIVSHSANRNHRR